MSYLLEGAAVLTVDTENAVTHRMRATVRQYQSKEYASQPHISLWDIGFTKWNRPQPF